MTDTTEPAVPVVAAIPIQAYQDLLHLAAADIGGLHGTGVRVAWDFTEGQGATVQAVATVLHVTGGTLDAGVKVTYRGRAVGYGGFVQWTRD